MRERNDMVVCYIVRPTADGASHEFLQMRRRADDYMGGTWQTVYGTSEAGETAWQAALRELHEEAGLSPTEFYRIDCVQTFYTAVNDTLWHAVPFAAIVRREDEVRMNEEHDAARWIARDAINDAFMWETDRACIGLLCRDVLDGSAAKPYLKIEVNDGR
jgi:dihydroneopterin triphosphate diphosphatase